MSSFEGEIKKGVPNKVSSSNANTQVLSFLGSDLIRG